MHRTDPLPWDSLSGISDRTNQIHHDKLYAGYVNKRNEIEEKLAGLSEKDYQAGNQVYSLLRGLKTDETFAANGMILHQIFFSILGGDGNPSGEIVSDINDQFGSVGRFYSEFKACAMAARGWAILALDHSDHRLHIYTADAQNQGGVWGSFPILPVDVYEHSYFIDFGSDRASYLDTFWHNLNWKEINRRYESARRNQ